MSDLLMVKDYKKGRKKRLREKIVLDNNNHYLTTMKF